MNAKEKAIKSLGGFRLNVVLNLDVDYDVYKTDDIGKAIDIAIRTTIKDIYAFKFYDVQTEDIAKWQIKFKDELIKELKKRHLSTSQKEKELN